MERSDSEIIGKSSVLSVERLNFDLPHFKTISFWVSFRSNWTSEPGGSRLAISKKVTADTDVSPGLEISASTLSEH